MIERQYYYNNTGDTITKVGGKPYSIEKARQNGYIKKFDGLSVKEKKELEQLWINNFDEIKTYDELYPGNDLQEKSKRNYFYLNNYKLKQKYVREFFDEMIAARFKNKCFNKENLALQTLKLHRDMLSKGKEALAVEYWKVLLKLLGLTNDNKFIGITNNMPDVIKIIERGGVNLSENAKFDIKDTTGDEIKDDK